MKLIDVKKVELGYENEVLHSNLNFTVEMGDYICVLGANGTGKSTLMKALLSLHLPLSGSIEFLNGFSSKEIGYLPQQTKIQKNFPASVEEVVLSGCLNSLSGFPFYRKKERERCEENLKRLEIYPLRHKSYQELSGGQQQRVLLARCLCATKRLLLLDEPVAGLDIHTSSELYSLIEKLNKEEKLTVIMVTHDIHPALNSASKILFLSQHFSYFGKKEDFFQTPEGLHYLKEAGHSHA